MSHALYLFQISALIRSGARASAFVGRCCVRPPMVSILDQRGARCLATSKPSEANSPEPQNASPSSSDSSVSNTAGLNQEALFEAFDVCLDKIEAEAEDSLSPRERRKLEKEREVVKAREAHARRLDILSALPHELVVEPVCNKCPGCGCDLQSHAADRPGFLPPDREKRVSSINVSDAIEQEDGIASAPSVLQKEPKEAVCQRCYRLSHYGKIEPNLRVVMKRVSDAKDSLSTRMLNQPENSKVLYELSPAKFRKSLERLATINAIIIYLVDIFDFHGTFISSLRDVIGTKNPVVLAVNKTDLLPKNYKPSRVEGWIAQECASMGLRDIDSIQLISSTKGTGVKIVLAEALRLAKLRRADIYVIGAANVGKSSFINQLIDLRRRDRMTPRNNDSKARFSRPGALRRTGSITTSVVPGTTLDMIRIPLGAKVNLFDTPGLMMPHQLTNCLDEQELRAVLPSKNVEHVTFRLGEGKALHIGGLARIEIVSGRPFFFTCFFAPTVKIHPGRVDGAEDFLLRHVGGMLTPPYTAERLPQLGAWTSKSFTAQGEGWRRASLDIVLSGLGWVAVTGPGDVRLRVCVPKGVGVFTREPLMPFEAQTGVSTYTGSTAVNMKQINKTRRRRKEG